MKTTGSPRTSSTTRIGCRLARLRAAVSIAPSHAHVAACPACQRYFASARQLESALRQQASTSRLEPSNGFEQQLISALRSTPSPNRRPASAHSWALSGFVASVTAAALLFAFLLRPQQMTPAPNSISPAEGAAVIAATVESLSNGLVDRVIPSAGDLVTGNPLQREVALVYSDMRSALDFLALNFLPTAPQPQPERRI